MSLDIWLAVDVGVEDPHRLSGSNMNITHNVALMWEKAGCYDALYNSHGATAKSTLPSIRSAVRAMRDDPDGFRALNPENGWGDYDGALDWLTRWCSILESAPKAIIQVWK